MSRLLEVEGLHAAYGPVRVLEGLDFSVDERGFCWEVTSDP